MVSHPVCCHGNKNINKHLFRCKLLRGSWMDASKLFTAIKIDPRLSVFVDFKYVRGCRKKTAAYATKNKKRWWNCESALSKGFLAPKIFKM